MSLRVKIYSWLVPALVLCAPHSGALAQEQAWVAYASYRSMANAEQAQLKFEQTHQRSLSINTVELNGETFFRLLEGPYEAEAARNRIKELRGSGLSNAWYVAHQNQPPGVHRVGRTQLAAQDPPPMTAPAVVSTTASTSATTSASPSISP